MIIPGEIKNFISEQEIESVVKVMSKLPKGENTNKSNTASYYKSIGQGHALKNWFEKLVMTKVQKFFGIKCKMLFATLLNEEDPFEIHTDYFHKRIGEPFITILIPLGVNNVVDKISLAKLRKQYYHTDPVDKIGLCKTIIFNQTDTGLDSDVHTKKSYDNNFRKLYKDILNDNSSDLHSKELSHCDIEDLKKLTTKAVLVWERGNALYWDQASLHCSNNYTAHGITSKQAIVIHTYMENF
tara:strand:- start:249 stop:971 length:723 start_codon:yes stop_codon:yes gene_type:complete